MQLLAVNRPGYGRSDPHESDHRTVTDDTVAVADQLGIAWFAALGMSVGGPYALACAARHPGRVSSVGVVAAPAVLPELDPPRHRDDLAPEQRALFTRLSGGTVAEGVREALASTSGYLRDAAVTFRRWQFRPDQVSRPTWLWYGELDPNASVRNGRWLAERIPDRHSRGPRRHGAPGCPAPVLGRDPHHAPARRVAGRAQRRVNATSSAPDRAVAARGRRAAYTSAPSPHSCDPCGSTTPVAARLCPRSRSSASSG